MGTEAPRWWREMLGHLQVAAAAAAAADSSCADLLQPANMQAIYETASNLDCHDKVPKAVWKKVVALSVPSKLVSICCEQPNTSSSSSSSPSVMAQPFALAARCLLGQAKGAACTSSSSLTGTFLQQLQQSRMVEHLSVMMSGIARQIWELQSEAGSDDSMLAADLAAFAYNHKESWGPTSSRLHQLHTHAGQLWGAVWDLDSFIDSSSRSGGSGGHVLLLPIAVPALELSVLTIQHVSTCLQLLPAHIKAPPKPLWRALYCACNLAMVCMHWSKGSCSCCADMRQQLLRSPYFQPAVSICLLIAVYGTLISKDADSWQANAAAARSSDSGGAGRQQQSNSQQDTQWKQAAWDMACARHDALPACHYELLQLAGCSSKALLWAATDDPSWASKDLETLDSVCSTVAREGLVKKWMQQGNSKHWERDMAAAFLRPVVLLHWAWHYLADNPDQLVGKADPWALRALWASTMTIRSLQTQLLVMQHTSLDALLQARTELQQHQHKLSLHKADLAAAEAKLLDMAQEVGKLDAVLAELDAQLAQHHGDVEVLHSKQQALLRLQELQELCTVVLKVRGQNQELVKNREFIIDKQQQVLQHLQQKRREELQWAGCQATSDSLLDEGLQQQGPQQEKTAQAGSIPTQVFLRILDDALVLVCKFLNLLLPLAGRSSSSSGGSGGSGHSKYRAEFHVEVERCLSAIMVLVQSLTDSARTHCAGTQQDRSESQGRSVIVWKEALPLTVDAPVWFQHAAQLCAAFETYVRTAATTQAIGTPGERDGLLVESLVMLLDPNAQGLRGVLLQAAAAAGPGSKEQQQLYGLLRSMVKWAGVMGPQQQVMAECLRTAAAVATATMLARMCQAGSVGGGGSGAAAAAASSITLTGGQDSSTSQQHGMNVSVSDMSQAAPALAAAAGVSAAAAPAPDGVLPLLQWLWLLGVCCLQWSQKLALLPANSSANELVEHAAAAAAAAAAASSRMTLRGLWGVLAALPRERRNTLGVFLQVVAPKAQPSSLFQICLESFSVLDYLGLADSCCCVTKEHIAASIGLKHPALSDALTSVVGLKSKCEAQCTQLVSAATAQPEVHMPLKDFIQNVAGLGQALCAVPHKRCCNNPGCMAMCGPSELQLVKGKSNTCSGCRTARYCCSACMKQHWKQHRLVCKALAAAAAAAAAAAVAALK